MVAGQPPFRRQDFIDKNPYRSGPRPAIAAHSQAVAVVELYCTVYWMTATATTLRLIVMTWTYSSRGLRPRIRALFPPPCQNQPLTFIGTNSQTCPTGLRCGIQGLPKTSTTRSRSAMSVIYTKDRSFACSMCCFLGTIRRIKRLVDRSATSLCIAVHLAISSGAKSKN